MPGGARINLVEAFFANADTEKAARAERRRCREDIVHFAREHCWIYDPSGNHIRFDLWPAQIPALQMLVAERLVIWLKARQLGMTWIALLFALHTLLFRRGSTVLLFSRRDEEAKDLLERLKGMHRRLPDSLREGEVKPTNTHQWTLPNGSTARCFPTTAGDSYAATLAIVDEADLVPDLNSLLGSVKPTIDAGGKLLLLSRSDKQRPQSTFKNLYRSARNGESSYRHHFLPWNARPDRTAAWYEEQRRDSLARTGTLDSLFEQYPATDVEALAPNQLDKRILLDWLIPCFLELKPLGAQAVWDIKTKAPLDLPGLPTLRVYQPPVPGRKYIVGADPAEGNPTSDDSAAVILDAALGEHVAHLRGKIEPTVFADQIDIVGNWYNKAMVLCERANHGHAVLARLKAVSKLRRLPGLDGKQGWVSSEKGKTILYDRCADAVRNGEVLIHDPAIYEQLASIEGNTLRAPPGLMDDLADALALAVTGAPHALRPPPKLEYIG